VTLLGVSLVFNKIRQNAEINICKNCCGLRKSEITLNPKISTPLYESRVGIYEDDVEFPEDKCYCGNVTCLCTCHLAINIFLPLYFHIKSFVGPFHSLNMH